MSAIKEQLIELMRSGEIELISTHEQLSLPVIERIYKKMMLGLLFGSIQVAENAIINGHHRYLASLLADYTLDQTPCIRPRAKTNFDWTSVKLVDNDWDTEAKIKALNCQDAKYNDISLEELLEKSK
jgi:hypothetical protein